MNADIIKYRIRHPSFGWLSLMERTQFEAMKWREEFTHNPTQALAFSHDELRAPIDANGNSRMAILVQGYTGLKLEKVEAENTPETFRDVKRIMKGESPLT
jgi:hypothetical protein